MCFIALIVCVVYAIDVVHFASLVLCRSCTGVLSQLYYCRPRMQHVVKFLEAIAGWKDMQDSSECSTSAGTPLPSLQSLMDAPVADLPPMAPTELSITPLMDVYSTPYSSPGWPTFQTQQQLALQALTLWDMPRLLPLYCSKTQSCSIRKGRHPCSFQWLLD